MGDKFLFAHALTGVTMVIVSSSLEGAKGVLEKIVIDASHWRNYK